MREKIGCRSFAGLLVLAWLAAGCGGNEGLKIKHPWDPEYERYFDDSVDFTMNPESLSGQWLYDYKLELESRVSLADHILAVRVDSINLTTDAMGKEIKNLLVDVEKNVKGDFPGSQAILSVSDEQPGYDSFEIDDPRLMDKVYVAFIRVYEKEDGMPGLHWHLSPLSKGLMEGMDQILEDSKPKKKNDDNTKVYTIDD